MNLLMKIYSDEYLINEENLLKYRLLTSIEEIATRYEELKQSESISKQSENTFVQSKKTRNIPPGLPLQPPSKRRRL
jgi:hypothetical protein